MRTIDASPITAEELARILRDGIKKTPFEHVRQLAPFCKLPVAEVQRWFDGEELPRPRDFTRLLFAMPKLRYLSPRIVASRAREEDRKVSAEESDRPDPPASVPALPGSGVLGTFGAALRHCRQRDFLSRADLGSLLDVTSVAVEHWEDGTNIPVKENHEALLQLWPELRSYSIDPRDIPTPLGGSGHTYSRTLGTVARDQGLVEAAPAPPPAPRPAPTPPQPVPRPAPRPASIAPPAPAAPPPPPPPPAPVVEDPMPPAAPAPSAPSAPSLASDRLFAWIELALDLAAEEVPPETWLRALDRAAEDGMTPAYLAHLVRRARERAKGAS